MPNKDPQPNESKTAAMPDTTDGSKPTALAVAGESATSESDDTSHAVSGAEPAPATTTAAAALGPGGAAADSPVPPPADDSVAAAEEPDATAAGKTPDAEDATAPIAFSTPIGQAARVDQVRGAGAAPAEPSDFMMNRAGWHFVILLGVVLFIAAPIVLLAGPFWEQYRIRFTPKTSAGVAAAIVFLALLLLWAVLLDVQGYLGSRRTVLPQSASQEAWAKWRQRGLRAFVIGSDGRGSTSKAQAALWTIAVLFALVYLALVGRSPNCAHDPNVPALWNSTCHARLPAAPDTGSVFGGGFPGDLVVLLFGYAGALAAKKSTEDTGKQNPAAMAQAKNLKTGEKTSSLAMSTGQVFTNDEGHVDLLDTQYIVFTLFSIVYFLYQLVAVTKNSLPTLGGGLLALAGVSTLSYTVKKYLENQRIASADDGEGKDQ